MTASSVNTDLNWHPQRDFLFSELHSRPFQVIPSNTAITHLALIADQSEKEAQFAHLQALLKEMGADQPLVDSPCVVVNLSNFRVRWEKHMEFTSLTLLDLRDQPRDPFKQTALDRLPEGWLAAMPGTVVAAFHVQIEDGRAIEAKTPEDVRSAFDQMRLVGSSPQQGDAQVWTSFKAHEGGFGRFLVINRGMSDSQMGRLVQRLMEIETYRLMALLGLPEARSLGPVLSTMETALVELTHKLAGSSTGNEAEVLGELTDMAAKIEAHRARTTFRFSASLAYHDIVIARLEDLREDEVSGHLTMKEFLTRRLSPAVRSCATMQERLDDLSMRIDRAAQTIRTQVDLAIQSQNRKLLQSMDRRSRIQLMMQHTVEGLSVAAISYYAVGLVKYLTEALYTAGVEVNKDLVTGISVPVVIGIVWGVTRRIQSRFRQLADEQSEDKPEETR